MAKSCTSRVTIYINGKEVEGSVKRIRAEMNRYMNEICRTHRTSLGYRASVPAGHDGRLMIPS